MFIDDDKTIYTDHIKQCRKPIPLIICDICYGRGEIYDYLTCPKCKGKTKIKIDKVKI